jgi:hypothetical protein
LPPLRAISSVGSEHLVYTERVGGSNPSLPTKVNPTRNSRIFLYSKLREYPKLELSSKVFNF